MWYAYFKGLKIGFLQGMKQNWRGELQWLLDAYRAMVPVNKVLESMMTRYKDGEWGSLAFQVQMKLTYSALTGDKYAD
jgi:hypothetical protein